MVEMVLVYVSPRLTSLMSVVVSKVPGKPCRFPGRIATPVISVELWAEQGTLLGRSLMITLWDGAGSESQSIAVIMLAGAQALIVCPFLVEGSETTWIGCLLVGEVLVGRDVICYSVKAVKD